MRIINWMLNLLRFCGTFPYRGRFPHDTFQRSCLLGLWCFMRLFTHVTLLALQFNSSFHIGSGNSTLSKVANSNLVYIKDIIAFVQTLLLVTRSSKFLEVLQRMKSLKETCIMSTADCLKDPMFILTFLLSTGLCLCNVYNSVTSKLPSKDHLQWAAYIFTIIRQFLSFSLLPVLIITMNIIPKYLSVATRATVPSWPLGSLELNWHVPRESQKEAAHEERKHVSNISTISLGNNEPPFDSFFKQAQTRLIETEEIFFRFVEYVAPVMLLYSATAVIAFTSLLYLLYEDLIRGRADWIKIYSTITSFFMLVQPCMAADFINREVNCNSYLNTFH